MWRYRQTLAIITCPFSNRSPCNKFLIRNAWVNQRKRPNKLLRPAKCFGIVHPASTLTLNVRRMASSSRVTNNAIEKDRSETKPSNQLSAKEDEKRWQAQRETRQVLKLIRTYKQCGHLVAKIDPLEIGVKKPDLLKWTHGNRSIDDKSYFDGVNLRALAGGISEIHSHGFTREDLEIDYFIGDDLAIGPVATLRDIITELQELFCGYVGVEYLHLHNQDECEWILQALERSKATQLSNDEKINIYHQMEKTELFEKFLGRRFSGAKRFSIEGGESLIPGLNALLEHASLLGVESIQMGMAHRGRLSVVAHVLKRPLKAILSQFQPYLPDEPDYPNNSDDVRYHLGTCCFLPMPKDRILEVTLAANPSHLEAVNSVVLGEARARQSKCMPNPQKVMPLLIHGDAAMFQGSVREAFGLSTLQDFQTHGTIHIIINNQIGFTTLPREADSAMYCSDVAKITSCPVFHVNGDQPEEVVKVMRLAMEYRQKYQRDVVVDLVSYRRHGHNEQDSPEITAPVMYHHIHQHPTIVSLYGKLLHGQGILSTQKTASARAYELILVTEHEQSKIHPTPWDSRSDLTETQWRTQWNDHAIQTKEDSLPTKEELLPTKELLDSPLSLRPHRLLTNNQIDIEIDPNDVNLEKDDLVDATVAAKSSGRQVLSGVERSQLIWMGRALFQLPLHFTAHKKVEAMMNNRLRAMDTGDRVDWGTAEALAFGSLLVEGRDVRLSGQDCERGTFNQRHAVLYDQWEALSGRNVRLVPLNDLTHARAKESEDKQTGRFQICNSPLSEEGVLAFEYGYSLQDTASLVIWEAQFGDFANGAQTIIDTFIVSGEQKWQRRSSLVLLLPHGYEGQGSEHSSARMERFLQQCNQDADVFDANRDLLQALVNIHIVIPTTPAQYFHALRRQVVSGVQKPLIIFTPKYLLHHRPCHSDVLDMTEGTFYRSTLPPHPDDAAKMLPKEQIQKLIFCCGKIYYHLLQLIRSRHIQDIATIRIEQLAPFPFQDLADHVKEYPHAQLVWVQEEPKNMGAWTYCQPRFQTILDAIQEKRHVKYVGRDPSASPATGHYEVHVKELNDIIERALHKE